MFAANDTPPRLNAAVDDLVGAIEGVVDLHGLRHGILTGVRAMEAVAAITGDADQAGQQVRGVWIALDAVAEAVAWARAHEDGDGS